MINLKKKLALALTIFGLVMGGCQSGPPVTGDNPIPLSKEEAISTATKFTPFRVLNEIQATPPGPADTRMWILYGVDESQRQLAVWVRQRERVEGHVYLNDGISRSDAIAKVKAAGLVPDPAEQKPMLIDPRAPYWSIQIKREGGFVTVPVDFATGKIIDP